MASALNNWHPSDKSAHKILEPWVQVILIWDLTSDLDLMLLKLFISGVYSSSDGVIRGAYHSAQVGHLPADGAAD